MVVSRGPSSPRSYVVHTRSVRPAAIAGIVFTPWQPTPAGGDRSFSLLDRGPVSLSRRETEPPPGRLGTPPAPVALTQVDGCCGDFCVEVGAVACAPPAPG